jgi:flagellar export protein FliJ
MPPAPKASLERLLRLRHLEEDLAAQTLAACNRALRRLEQQNHALVLRRSDLTTAGMRALTAGEVALWQAGETEKQWSRSIGEQLHEEMEAAQKQMHVVREQFMVRRSARMAVETLVEENRQKSRYERDRREQQSIDEWFQIAGGKAELDRLPAESVENRPGLIEDE